MLVCCFLAVPNYQLMQLKKAGLSVVFWKRCDLQKENDRYGMVCDFLCRKLLHFNLAGCPVNFIKQFVSIFWCLYQILLSKFLSYYCLYNMPRILHIISWKCWYFMQINLWWWAVPKFCVYLISLFYWNREIRKNLMLAKYTCVTVLSHCRSCSLWYPLVHPEVDTHGRRHRDDNIELCHRQTVQFDSHRWQVIRHTALRPHHL